MSLVKVVRDGYDAETVAGSGWRLAPIALVNLKDALRKKLMEEVAEYMISGELEELADIVEVCAALAALVPGGAVGDPHVRRTYTRTELGWMRIGAAANAKAAQKGHLSRGLGLFLEPPEGVR